MSKPLGKPDRIVVALGGNALGNNPVEQIEAVSNTAHALLGLIEQGNEIIITHGNGPQVGMIQNAFAAAHDAIGTPEMPLPECGAMSQGYIGYHLQQGIGREMHKRYKRWHAATVVTQIECDPDDPAFKNPTKPIGPFYTEEQAKEFMAEDPSKVFVEDSGRGWRRVVASPDPKKIVEAGDATFAARFKQEAQAAAGLSSPYIVGVYDWGKDGDTYYIVMEYLRGTDLKSGIKSHGALDPKKVAQIGSQISSALSVAHKHEIIHRDIKPQNIMVLPDGNIKVMDFGIARAKNSHLTQDNNVLGTAHYVSPEQTRGQDLGPTSDIYSLGVETRWVTL